MLIRLDGKNPADLAGLPEQKEAIERELLSLKQREMLNKWNEEDGPVSKLSKPLEEL
jgi:hypothetical protein